MVSVGPAVRLATMLCAVAVLTLWVATLAAIGRSHDRLACYRTSATTDVACPTPTWFDKAMAALLIPAVSVRKG